MTPRPCAHSASIRLLGAIALALSLLAAGSGCQLLGIAASKLPPPTIPAAYDNLAGQRTAVWVWVDPAVDLDYPRLSLDVATGLQRNLETARDTGGAKEELAGVSFPIQPASIVMYQKRDPMLNMAPITQVAPQLDVERLIYIEITSFTTQGGAAAGLLRGVAGLNISAIEIDLVEKTAHEAYQEQGIELIFPPGEREEGSSSLTERIVYQGLVRRIGDQAALRFVPHTQEEYP